MMNHDELSSAIGLAERVADDIRNSKGDLSAAYIVASQAAQEYEQEHGNLRAVLPASEEIGQGFLSGEKLKGMVLDANTEFSIGCSVCGREYRLNQDDLSRIRSGASVEAAALLVSRVDT